MLLHTIDLLFARHLEVLDQLIEDGESKLKLMIDLEEQTELLRDVCKSAFILKEASPKIRDYILSFGEKFSGRIIQATLNQNISATFFSAEDLICTDNKFGDANPNYPITKQRLQKVTTSKISYSFFIH